MHDNATDPDERHVATWDDALRLLMDLRDNEFFSFRGQNSHNWKLGIHHPPAVTESDLQDGFTQFRKRCMEFPKPDYIDEGQDWRWLFFAQHYRLWTRLLDWTTNPLVALYFAVENILTDRTKLDKEDNNDS